MSTNRQQNSDKIKCKIIARFVTSSIGDYIFLFDI